MAEHPPEARSLLEKLSDQPDWDNKDGAILFFLRDTLKFFSRCYSYRPKEAYLLNAFHGDFVTTVHRLKNTSRAIAIDLSYHIDKGSWFGKKTYSITISEFHLIATAGMPVDYEILKNGRWTNRKELFCSMYEQHKLPKIIRTLLDYWHERNPKKHRLDEIFKRLEQIESLMYNQLQNPNLNFIE